MPRLLDAAGRWKGACLCLVMWATACGAAPPPPEALIKAALIFNFTKVVDWRSTPATDSEFVLGVVGDGPTAAALRTFEGRVVANSVVHVRVVRHDHDLRDCQLVFFEETYRDSVVAALQSTAGASVLTVSGLDGFAEQGGMIQLVRRQNRIRVIVNLDAANRAGLRISSQLLRMAEIVGRDDRAPSR